MVRPYKLRPSQQRWRSGSSVIEVVFAFQVLMLLAFGMVEFGQYFYIRHAFEGAARDGARLAILPSATQTAVNTVMLSTLKQALPNLTSFNTSWLAMTQTDPVTGSSTSLSDIANASAGNEVTIKLSAAYDTLPGVYRPLYAITTKGIANGKQVTGQATMVKE